MDVWSVGCILAEMLNNKPLFPGENYQDQILKIQEILGTPSAEEISFIRAPLARAYLLNLPPKPKVTWSNIFPNANMNSLELLDLLLTFDPSRRIKVEHALVHPYLGKFHDPADEPMAEIPFTFEMELDNLPIQQLKEMIYKEALLARSSQ